MDFFYRTVIVAQKAVAAEFLWCVRQEKRGVSEELVWRAVQIELTQPNCAVDRNRWSFTWVVPTPSLVSRIVNVFLQGGVSPCLLVVVGRFR